MKNITLFAIMLLSFSVFAESEIKIGSRIMINTVETRSVQKSIFLGGAKGTVLDASETEVKVRLDGDNASRVYSSINLTNISHPKESPRKNDRILVNLNEKPTLESFSVYMGGATGNVIDVFSSGEIKVKLDGDSTTRIYPAKNISLLLDQ